jgi:hypothetical protein
MNEMIENKLVGIAKGSENEYRKSIKEKGCI